MPPVVSHPAAIAPAWAQLRTKRCNIVGVYDSNGVFQGYGWDEGLAAALFANPAGPVTMWGSGVQTRTQYDAVNLILSSTEAGFQIAATGGAFLAAAGAPAGLHELLGQFTQPACITHRYSYIGAGVPDAPWTQAVSMLVADAAIGPASRLRFHQQVGLFPGGAGQYRNVVRNNLTPFPEVARDLQPRTLAAPGATPVTREDFFDVQALAGRTFPLSWRLTTFGVNEIASPAWFGWLSVENRDRPAGFRSSVLISGAGQSLREMVLALRDTTGGGAIDMGPMVRGFLARVADQPNAEVPSDGTEPILFVVNSGANDVNRFNELSLGPNPALSHTAEGYRDNLVALVEIIRTRLEETGIDPARAFFIFLPTHPSFTPKESALASYREAAAQAAGIVGRATSIDLGGLTTPAQMQTAGDYYLGTDENHLTAAGYLRLSTLVVAAIEAAIAEIPEPEEPAPVATAYLSVDETTAIINANLPSTHRGRLAWAAASNADRAACCELATSDLDAVRWDGVPQSEDQLLAWPRYERMGSSRALGLMDPNATGAERTPGLPLKVRIACAVQSAHHAARARGLDPTGFLREAARVGVVSQSGGGQAQTIDLTTASSAWAGLCAEAQQQLRNFRLSGGSFV